MNWNNVKELLNINFLAAHPQVTSQVQAKQAQKPKKKFSAIKSVRNQFLILSLVFFVLYSGMFIGIDYSKSPGYFSIQLALFSLIALGTGFNSLFAVFYDSKDTKLYLSLPVKSEEVYLAKLLAAQPAILTYLIPLLSLLAIAYWQIGSPVIAIVLTLPMFLLLLLAINTVSLLLLDRIGQVLEKSRHKKIISTGLVVLSTLLSVGLIFLVQSSSTSVRLAEDGGLITAKIPYFIGFYHVVANPFSLDSVLHFWLPNALLIALVIYILKRVIPTYFNQMLKISANQGQVTRKQRTNSKEYSLKEAIVRHHLSTIKDGNLLMQAFLMPLIIGFSGLMPIISSEGANFSAIAPSYYGTALILGLMLGALTTGATSLLSVGISLERENLNFIRTLPINFISFLQSKFYTLLLVQIVPILALHILGGLILRLSPLLILAYTIGYLAAAYLVGLRAYRRDYKLLDLNWQNINQLFSRGHGQWVVAFTMLGVMFLGMLLIIGSIIIGSFVSPHLISAGLTALALVVLLIAYWFVGRDFWKTFE